MIVLAASALSGCDDDADRDGRERPAADASMPRHLASPRIFWNSGAFHARSSSDAAVPDAAAPPVMLTPEQQRGEYLVRHVAGCMECHTPRLPSGAFDETKLLSGVENLADVEPDDPERGLLHSRNLTPDRKTGLGRFSDEQIKHAFQGGVDDEGTVLHWMMPYWIYHNMHDDDADAVVAFLRTIPAISHSVPDNQPNAVDTQKPYKPYALPVDALPQPTAASGTIDRGRYLATSVSPCLFCHTPPAAEAQVPLAVSLAYTGRRKFVPVRLGSADALTPGQPLIESMNLTPSAHGIIDWKPSDIDTLLRQGVNKKSLPVCDPMPSSTGGSFTGMTQDDALALGEFFTRLPPKDTGEIAVCCSACHKHTPGIPDADAGRDDAGR